MAPTSDAPHEGAEDTQDRHKWLHERPPIILEITSLPSGRLPRSGHDIRCGEVRAAVGFVGEHHRPGEVGRHHVDVEVLAVERGQGVRMTPETVAWHRSDEDDEFLIALAAPVLRGASSDSRAFV